MLQEIVETFHETYKGNPTAVGVSSMVDFEKRYVFTLAREEYWTPYENGVKIGYSCVGGTVEKGETFYDALKREAQEEIDSPLNIINSDTTVYVNLERTVKKIEIEDKYSPKIVFEQELTGSGNLLASGKWYLLVSVFYAEVTRKPKPSSEVPAVLILDKDTYRSSLKVMKLSNVLRKGGILIKQRHIPDNCYIEPEFSSKVVGELFYDKLEEMFPL